MGITSNKIFQRSNYTKIDINNKDKFKLEKNVEKNVTWEYQECSLLHREAQFQQVKRNSRLETLKGTKHSTYHLVEFGNWGDTTGQAVA